MSDSIWSDENLDKAVNQFMIDDSIKSLPLATVQAESTNVDTGAMNIASSSIDSSVTDTSVTDTSGTDIAGSNSPFVDLGKNKNNVEDLSKDIEKANDAKSIAEEIAPYAILGGAELLYRSSLKIPSFTGKGQAVRKGGAFALSFDLALKTQDYMRNFLQESHPPLMPDPMHEGVAYAGGAVAGAGAYGYGRYFVNTVLPNLRMGFAQEGLHSAMEKSAEIAVKKMNISKFEINPENRIKVVADKAKNEAAKEIVPEIKKRIGKEASEEWDDVARQLIKPGKAHRIGIWLGKHGMKKTADKLALSAAAIVIPETFSTIIGGASFLFAVWDIYRLAQSAPDLYRLIFDESADESDAVSDSVGATTEDKIISSLAPGGRNRPSQ